MHPPIQLSEPSKSETIHVDGCQVGVNKEPHGGGSQPGVDEHERETVKRSKGSCRAPRLVLSTVLMPKSIRISRIRSLYTLGADEGVLVVEPVQQPIATLAEESSESCCGCVRRATGVGGSKSDEYRKIGNWMDDIFNFTDYSS